MKIVLILALLVAIKQPSAAPEQIPVPYVAPIHSYEGNNPQTVAYIKRWAHLALFIEMQTSVPASIILAQGIIESNRGLSKCSKVTDNHFGVKCQKRRCKKGHCYRFADETPYCRFLKFSSPVASFVAQGRRLRGGRYTKLAYVCGKDYQRWADCLQQKGYATDRRYADKLKEIINRYGLFDHAHLARMGTHTDSKVVGCMPVAGHHHCR